MIRDFTRRELRVEGLNTLTHGLGSIFGIVGLFLLLNKENIGPLFVSLESTSYLIYGLSMIVLFTASALYHAFSFTRLKALFQKIDHASIYLLIAGSYTPYLILAISGRLGYSFLVIIWLAAIAGIVFEVVWTNCYPKLSTFLYLTMGWVSLFLIYPLYQALSLKKIILLILGGLFYSIGTYFYQKKHIDWMHTIWHLFVLAGATFIFFSIYLL